jgi:Putative 2OG-Fe(II) oxygenase
MWFGVYYVSGGQPDSNDPCNGTLELIDPRAGANNFPFEVGFFGRYLAEPIPGLMVMFPSWLKHMVHPFSGSGERISISFNVNVQFQQQTK